MSDETPQDSARRKAGLVPPAPSDADTKAVQAEKLSQSLAEEFLQENKTAEEGYQGEQKYAKPFLSVDRSSVGDVVAGTMHKVVNVYTTSSTRVEVAVDQVSEPEIERVRTVYVMPRPYERAVRTLDERRVLILWGESACGKATTALQLLLQRQKIIFRLDPTTNLEQLRAHEFHPGQGYLIDTLTSETAQKLKSFILGVLSGKLLDKQSYLVLTVDGQVTLDRAELSDYLVQWRERPSPDQVLERHLFWLIPEDEQAARDEVRLLMAEQAVQEFLNSNPPLRAVSELAALLKHVVDGDLVFDHAIQQVSFFALRQVQDWFRNPARTLREQCLMITLAVYNGATQQIINEADAQLRQLIDSPLADPKLPQSEQSLFVSARERFRTVCANLQKAYEETNVGTTEVTVIQFDNPSFQRVVLEHVWEEYDQLHALLLTWFKRLGCHADADVRGRAAAALGWLGRYDFSAVVNNVVLPWADDERWQVRAAAALALGVLAYDDRFTSNIIGLLQNWSRAQSSRNLRLTAVVAYGGLVGERYPNLALQRLCLLTQVNRAEPQLLNAVAHSVVALFQRHQQDIEHARKVLEALVLWTESPGYAIAVWTGLVAYLRLAQVSSIEAIPGEGVWPTLLWLLHEDEECRTRITVLWQRALKHRLTSRQALRGPLRQWLRRVDNDNRLSPAFEQLLIALATQGDENDYERIETFLENRVEDPRDQSRVADKILALLQR